MELYIDISGQKKHCTFSIACCSYIFKCHKGRNERKAETVRRGTSELKGTWPKMTIAAKDLNSNNYL